MAFGSQLAPVLVPVVVPAPLPVVPEELEVVVVLAVVDPPVVLAPLVVVLLVSGRPALHAAKASEATKVSTIFIGDSLLNPAVRELTS
jgi:hypothetical protein